MPTTEKQTTGVLKILRFLCERFVVLAFLAVNFLVAS